MNKTHAILTYSKIHYLVTKEQAEIAVMLKSGEEKMIGENFIKGSNISDVITIEKYYESFPQKRENQADLFKPDPKLLEGKPFNAESTCKQGLAQIIEGLGRYIASTEENPIRHKGETPVFYKGTQVPIELFERLTKKLALTQ